MAPSSPRTRQLAVTLTHIVFGIQSSAKQRPRDSVGSSHVPDEPDARPHKDATGAYDILFTGSFARLRARYRARVPVGSHISAHLVHDAASRTREPYTGLAFYELSVFVRCLFSVVPIIPLVVTLIRCLLSPARHASCRATDFAPWNNVNVDESRSTASNTRKRSLRQSIDPSNDGYIFFHERQVKKTFDDWRFF